MKNYCNIAGVKHEKIKDCIIPVLWRYLHESIITYVNETNKHGFSRDLVFNLKIKQISK